LAWPGLDGTVWLGRWEAYEAIGVTQELEEKLGLVRTPGYAGPKERKTLSASEINMAVRTKTEPPKQGLQKMLDALVESKHTILELAYVLEAKGVEVRVKLYGTGTISGISFGLEGITFKGSSLGKGYSWGGLKKRGVTYEQARDSEGLGRYAATGRDAAGADNASGMVEIGAAEGNGAGGVGQGRGVKARGDFGQSDAMPEAGGGRRVEHAGDTAE
jgi:hypothetical protein